MHVNLENAEKAIEAARKHAMALKTQMCCRGRFRRQSQSLSAHGTTPGELPEHPWRT